MLPHLIVYDGKFVVRKLTLFGFKHMGLCNGAVHWWSGYPAHWLVYDTKWEAWSAYKARK